MPLAVSVLAVVDEVAHYVAEVLLRSILRAQWKFLRRKGDQHSADRHRPAVEFFPPHVVPYLRGRPGAAHG